MLARKSSSSSSEFWTFLNMGRGAPLPALRNAVELGPGREEFKYVRLDNPGDRPPPWDREELVVQPGDGFGQFCLLDDDCEKWLRSEYKSVSSVLGRSYSEGLDAAQRTDVQSLLDPLLHEAGCSARGLHVPDSYIEKCRDVASYNLPFGLANKFKIYLSPMTSEEELPDVIRERRHPELKGLKFGLPSPCDSFREAPFTGTLHALGIVPAIGKYQFVTGSGLDGTWVRFDSADFASYDHDLRGLPVLRDEQSIVLPVTHLWVDFSFTSPIYCLEWFFAGRCLARKEISIRPMPNFIYQQVTGLVRLNLKKTRADARRVGVS